MAVSRPKTKRPFHVPWSVNVRYIVYLNRWVRQTIFVLITIIISIGTLRLTYQGINFYEQVQSSSRLLQDAGFTGLFGALIGAAIASVIGGITAYYLQAQQLQSVSIRQKKIDIYIPLYNNLIKLKNDMKTYEHPDFFTADPNDPLVTISLSLLEWGAIERDIRLVQVPDWIIEAFNGFVNNFTVYQEMKTNAFNLLKNQLILTAFLMDTSNTTKVRNSLDTSTHLVRDVLMNRSNSLAIELQQTNGGYYSRPEDIEPEFKQAGQLLLMQCLKMPEFQEIIKYYNLSVINYLDWLIYDISTIIRYIHVRYENESNTI